MVQDQPMSDVVERTMQYLGLVGIEPREGYAIPNRRFPTQQVCDECGALVPPSRQAHHTAWHLQHVQR